MFKREFSLAFLLLWAGGFLSIVLSLQVATGQPLSAWVRIALAMLLGIVAWLVEGLMARRYGERQTVKAFVRSHKAGRR